MPKISCTAHSCVYNTSNCCSLSDVKVGGSGAKKACDTPVFASNGVRAETVKNTLSIADGCVVGTWLKVDGKFYNEVDPQRVKELMNNAREAR